jgi:hypothetical protein
MVIIQNIQLQSVEENMIFMSSTAVHKLTTIFEGLEILLFRRTSPPKFMSLGW